MIRRVLTIGAVLGAAAAAGCLDMSAPKGPASISLLQFPAMFVVRGDTMRDSLGNAAPPRVIAYDVNGNPISGFAPTFFVTDSAPAAHLANGLLVAGDTLGQVHVIGQIGSLQTAAVTINVTAAPTQIVATGATDTLRAPVGADSASSLGSTTLGVAVRGADSTAVPGMYVRYTLVRTLASSSTSPAVYLTDASGNLSSLDTTKTDGTSTRRVVVVSRFLTDPALVSGQHTDSVIVEAHAKYRGSELRGGPVRFVIPVKVTFALP